LIGWKELKNLTYASILSAVVIESLSAHQGVVAAADRNIPAIEARPDSRADCPVQLSDPKINK